MSRVKNRQELLDEIGILVDNYIEYIIKKGKRKHLRLEEKREKKAKFDITDDARAPKEQVKEKEKEEEPTKTTDDDENQCLVVLKNGSRCSRPKKGDKATATENPQICFFHNNDRFVGKLKYYDPADPSPKRKKKPIQVVIDSEKLELSSNDSDEKDNENGSDDDDDDDDDLVCVSITVDADGNAIDANNNLWSLENRTIIGKRDPKTKEITVFKKI